MRPVFLLVLALQAAVPMAQDTAGAAPAGVPLGRATDSLSAPAGTTSSPLALPPRIVVEIARGDGSISIKDLLPSIVAALAILAALGTNWIQLRQKNRELKQKDDELGDLRRQRAEEQQRQDRAVATALDRQLDEEERRRIAGELNDFYHPLKRHLDVSKLLYEQLLRSPPRPAKDFRTVFALLRGDKFTANQKALIKEIIATNVATRRLILKGRATVTNPDFASLLATAAFHFRVMELADAKTLTANDEATLSAFDQAKYPRKLNGAIDTAIQAHEARLRELEIRASKRASLTAPAS